MSELTILVTGATGRIGDHLIEVLATEDVHVQAMTRRPEHVPELLEQRAELVKGDFSDQSSLNDALIGVDRAFLLSPVLQEMAELQKNFVDAAERAEVTHLVKLSAAGADFESQWDIARWHGEVEDQINESDIPHTHLRPVFYMQNLLDAAEHLQKTGVLERPAPESTRINMIDTRDVAAVAARTLTKSGHANATYKLTGRRLVSLAEVVDTLSQVAERELTYQETSPNKAKEVFLDQGSPEWLADEQVALFQGFAKGAGDVKTDDVEEVLGRQPRSLREFVDDHADVFRTR